MTYNLSAKFLFKTVVSDCNLSGRRTHVHFQNHLHCWRRNSQNYSATSSEKSRRRCMVAGNRMGPFFHNIELRPSRQGIPCRLRGREEWIRHLVVVVTGTEKSRGLHGTRVVPSEALERDWKHNYFDNLSFFGQDRITIHSSRYWKQHSWYFSLAVCHAWGQIQRTTPSHQNPPLAWVSLR